jgi:2,3-dihydroxybenzoate decarboxylase
MLKAIEKLLPWIKSLPVLPYLPPGLLTDNPAMLVGRPELNGATWSWTCETASHALRLIYGGIFDRFSAQVILGHMGETLPFDLWRFHSRSQTTSERRAINKGAWFA